MAIRMRGDDFLRFFTICHPDVERLMTWPAGTRVERVLSSLTPQCPERRRASAGAQGSVGRAATYPPPATIEWLLNGG